MPATFSLMTIFLAIKKRFEMRDVYSTISHSITEIDEVIVLLSIGVVSSIINLL